MKSQTAILPFIDLVFLALGGVLACMTKMEMVTALPISVTRIGKGSAIVQHEKFAVLTVAADGMSLDGKSITKDQLPSQVANKKIILRVDKALPTQRTVQVIGELAKAGVEMSIEVKEIDSLTSE